MEYHSAIKKNEMLFTATWMDVEIVVLREVSQTEKEKYHMAIPYIWNLKRNGTNELTYKTYSVETKQDPVRPSWA